MDIAETGDNIIKSSILKHVIWFVGELAYSLTTSEENIFLGIQGPISVCDAELSFPESVVCSNFSPA